VADSKRNFVYGLHAVNAALERAPERVLELWIVQARDDARTRDLKDRADRVGVHVHSVSGDALGKLVGDVVHQGAVAAMRPLRVASRSGKGSFMSVRRSSSRRAMRDLCSRNKASRRAMAHHLS